MKFSDTKPIYRWMLTLMASFVMYEVLWAVIEYQFEAVSFELADVLWDLAQCALFTSVVFIVNWAFARFRGGRYARGVTEIATLLIVNALVIFLTDKVFIGQDASDADFWSVIDAYVICVICSLLSIIDIQHTYNKRLVAMKQEQMQLRLRLLQQQLSPHFMFNSLSTLQGVIATDPQRAEEYVAMLSDILRYITKNIGKEKVPLADAVSFIKSYAQMLSVRFPEHFVFRIDVNGAPCDACVIPVSLQIAVENAIKHNIHSRKSPLEISITLGDGVVEVSNKRQPVAFADGLGVGLSNLNERYRLLTGRELGFKETDDYYTVAVPFV